LGEPAIIEDDELMLTREETARTAVGYAEQGFLCSEAVLMAIGDLLGFKSEAIPRMATGFGAGIGRRGEICGAVSGGVMGLGLRFGRDAVESDEEERRPYWYAAEFLDGFRGSVRRSQVPGSARPGSLTTRGHRGVSQEGVLGDEMPRTDQNGSQVGPRSTRIRALGLVA
jgi:C_GCAxxG_C_C family probable redox protein